MQKRSVINSPRLKELKKRRRRIFWVKALFFLVGISVILVGLTYLSRINKLNITQVEVVGNKIVDNDQIITLVKADLLGKYLYLFPKTNFLFYPKNKIEADLINNFKRLTNISFSIKNTGTLLIKVSEREGLYTWCGEVPPQDMNIVQKCYFVDKTGFIFDEAPYFSGEVYFRFYGKLRNNYYIDFDHYVLFKNNLEAMSLKLSGLYIKEDNGLVFLASTALGVLPEIRFKLGVDLTKIAENLQTALTTEPLQTDFRKKYNALKYIDLRFGNKVYYKF